MNNIKMVSNLVLAFKERKPSELLDKESGNKGLIIKKRRSMVISKMSEVRFTN